MSKVIESFLVALGFEVDDKSERQTTQSIDRVKSTALQMGKVFAASFAAGGYAAKRTAKDIDELNSTAKLLVNVSPKQLDVLGTAIELVGGNSDEAASALESLQSIITELRTGRYGEIEELANFGIPTEFIQGSRTALELLERAAAIIPTLDPELQVKFSDTLKLPSGVQLLIKDGPEEFSETIKRATELSRLNQSMLDDSRDLTRSFTELGISLRGLFREFTGGSAADLAKTIDTWTESLMGFTDEARQLGDLFGDAASLLNPNTYLEMLGPQPSVNTPSQRSRRLSRNKSAGALPDQGIVNYVIEKSDSTTIKNFYDRISATPNEPGENRRSQGARKAGNVNIERLEIKVEASNNPEVTANKMIDKLSSSIMMATESANGPMAG